MTPEALFLLAAACILSAFTIALVVVAYLLAAAVKTLNAIHEEISSINEDQK